MSKQLAQNRPSSPKDHSLFELFIPLIFILVAAGVALYEINKSNILGLCDVNSPLLSPSTNWKISSSTFDAEIVWEGIESGSSSPVSNALSYFNLALSDENVLYGQHNGKEICDVNPVVIAYDRHTGHEQWRFRPDRINPRLFSTSMGYVLQNNFSIVMLDFQGKMLWSYTPQDAVIPTRSFNKVYESEGDLYLAEHEVVYRVSSQTGELIETLHENVLDIFDGYAVIGTGRNQAKLVSLNNLQQPIYTLEFPASSPYFPSVRHQDNYLFFYFGSYTDPHDWKVDVYRLDTGERLWHLDIPFFYVFPVIFEDSGVVVFYTAGDKLKVMDIDTGELLGEIVLTRENTNAVSNPAPLTTIIVAGDDDTLFIRRSDTLELIALHINFTN